MQIDVHVLVEEDGSGVVEVVVGVDPDGVERIGGDLGAVLEVDDLVEAGWTVDEPVLEDDGFTQVRIRRSFTDPDGAATIFADIAGEDGPFQDFAVGRDTSFARTEWTFDGRVDFSGGLEAFGDEALAAELDGEPLGQTVEEIEAQLGDSLSRLIQVRVGVRLPGEVTSNATTKADDGAVWQIGFGDGELDLTARGEETRSTTLIAVGVAVACLAALLVYGLVRLAKRAAHRRRSAPAGDDATA